MKKIKETIGWALLFGPVVCTVVYVAITDPVQLWIALKVITIFLAVFAWVAITIWLIGGD